MSQENLSVLAVINRRERRIVVKLYETSVTHKNIPCFEPGEEISGVVSLDTFGGEPIERVRLAIVCLEQIKWINRSASGGEGGNAGSGIGGSSHHGGGGDQARRKSLFDTVLDYAANAFTGPDKRIHFERDIVLQTDINKERLIAGKYDLPFRVTLPLDGLYSTMRSCHGFIRYTLEVTTLDEDGTENRAEREVIILAPLPERFDMGVGRAMEKSLLIPQVGRITLSGTLESREYAPGDTIRLVLNCHNESTVPVQPLITLYQTQSFSCSEHCRNWDTVLNDTIEAEVVESQASCSQTIRIPLSGNAVLSLRSAMIGVGYLVHITIDELPGSYDLSLSIPFLVVSRRSLALASPANTLQRTALRQISAPAGFQDSPQPQFRNPHLPAPIGGRLANFV